MISVSVEILAPLNLVWEAYTQPHHIVHWNAASDDWHTTHSTVDLREGGRFSSRMEARDGSEGFDFEGVYTRIVDRQIIEYEFGGRAARVSFATSADISQVTVEFEPESTHPVDIQQGGWQAILDNFKKYVERLL
jgi:uncharacterized protein YndB with AHSA1/START domain